MADYYRKDEQINGTHYRIYVEAADGTPRQASVQLVKVAEDEERSLMDTQGRFTMTAKDLPALRHNLNAAMRGLGVGADLEEVGIFPRHYQEWTREEDEELIFQYQAGNELTTIAERLGRSAGAVYRRLKRHEFDPDEIQDFPRAPRPGNGPPETAEADLPEFLTYPDPANQQPQRGVSDAPEAPPDAPPPPDPEKPSAPPAAPADSPFAGSPSPPSPYPMPPQAPGDAEERRRTGGGPFRLGR